MALAQKTGHRSPPSCVLLLAFFPQGFKKHSRFCFGSADPFQRLHLLFLTSFRSQDLLGTLLPCSYLWIKYSLIAFHSLDDFFLDVSYILIAAAL